LPPISPFVNHDKRESANEFGKIQGVPFQLEHDFVCGKTLIAQKQKKIETQKFRDCFGWHCLTLFIFEDHLSTLIT